MLTEGRHRPAASGADAGAYGKELAKRVQTDLEGKTVGGGTFMFNTGVNLTTKKVDKLNVTQGTKDFADVDIMWLEDGKKLNVGDTVNPAKVLAYEMKTLELRDADAAAGPRREGSTSRSLARKEPLDDVPLRDGSKDRQMIQNPNFSKTMTFFSVVGGAVGIYEMFNVDSAEAAAAEQQLRAALTRLQSHNYTDLGDQRREVAWAVKKYVDVLTAGNIAELPCSMVYWWAVMKTLEDGN